MPKNALSERLGNRLTSRLRLWVNRPYHQLTSTKWRRREIKVEAAGIEPACGDIADW